MNNDSDWQNDAPEKKGLKRKAANEFLKKARDNPDFRALVMTDTTHPNAVQNATAEQNAHTEFGKMCIAAGIELPDYVRVICLDDERTARNHLVIFALPRSAATRLAGDDDLWRDGWLAAWDPY
jgi:hypothetical protein